MIRNPIPARSAKSLSLNPARASKYCQVTSAGASSTSFTVTVNTCKLSLFNESSTLDEETSSTTTGEGGLSKDNPRIWILISKKRVFIIALVCQHEPLTRVNLCTKVLAVDTTDNERNRYRRETPSSARINHIVSSLTPAPPSSLKRIC